MSAMLELAKVAIPGLAWVEIGPIVALRDDFTWPFDPIHNPDQFCEVLAWLLRQAPTNRVSADEVYTYDHADKGWERKSFPHDGTHSGIRRAVVEAALKVVDRSSAVMD